MERPEVSSEQDRITCWAAPGRERGREVEEREGGLQRVMGEKGAPHFIRSPAPISVLGLNHSHLKVFAPASLSLANPGLCPPHMDLTYAHFILLKAPSYLLREAFPASTWWGAPCRPRPAPGHRCFLTIFFLSFFFVYLHIITTTCCLPFVCPLWYPQD